MRYAFGYPSRTDATIVRGVLLPATMTLLGDRNRYLPRTLEWLPRLQPVREPARAGRRARQSQVLPGSEAT